MVQLLIIFTVFTSILVGASPKDRRQLSVSDEKIIGGEEADIKDFPYQLSFQLDGKHICGASIIAPTKAVTAAHCTEGNNYLDMRVQAGTSKIGKGGQIVDVARVCQHPDYDSKTYDNDVAVLLLAEPMKFGKRAKPISLASPGAYVPIGTLGTVVGWGRTTENGTLSQNLQKIKVPRIKDKDCAHAYKNIGKITPNMICFGYVEGGKDSCQGDSGGAIAVNETQVGIVSWGNGCANTDYPGVYSNIGTLRHFIDNCK